jgi:hypothetical protein
MDKLNEISSRLRQCLSMPQSRIFLLANENQEFISVVCFFLIGDTFKNIEELKEAVEKCVKDLDVSIRLIGDKGAITITPN